MSTCRLPAADRPAAPDTEGAEAGAPYPCVQGLIAANVALMTAYANPAPDARVDMASQRRLLARKVASNLFFLREHPLLSPGLRQVMAHAHQHWVALAAAAATPAAAWAEPVSALRH
jgi:hypothetical protein